MNKKKRNFFTMLAMIFVLPLAFLLAACGGEDVKEKTLRNVYIQLDDQESYSSQAYIYEEYNQNFTVSSLYGRVSFIFEYSDGSKKKADNENFTQEELEAFSYSETYYKGRGYDEQTGEHLGWDVVQKEQIDDHAAINVGEYKIVFAIEGFDTTLEIRVEKVYSYQKNVNIAVVGNDVTKLDLTFTTDTEEKNSPLAGLMDYFNDSEVK